MNNKQKALFFGIIALAIFFRFYQIVTISTSFGGTHVEAGMPGGLFPDMAANGLDINLMQQGHLQPFYERGNGREALFFYMEWASVALFGKGVWQFSIVSALMGVLAVIACYFVTYRLLLVGQDANDPAVRKKTVNISLLAMFLMAVSAWHVVLSRTAFRATLIPFFSAISFYFLLRTYQAVTTKTRLWFAFLFGMFFALGFYTYIAYRIMAIILVMAVLWPFLAQLKQRKFGEIWQRYKTPLLLAVIAFLIFIFPIAKYFITHPGSFVGRAGQVSVFNQELYTINGTQTHTKPAISVVLSVIGTVFKAQFLGIFTHGDLNWRQNISGYPFLSPLVSPFFAVGVLIVAILGIWYFLVPIKRAKWWKYYALTGWFFGMMLPVVTTAEGIPHGLRGIGIIPPLFIISAIALYEVGNYLYRWHKKIWEKCWCHPATSPWEAAQKGDITANQGHPHSARFKFISFMLKVTVVCFVVASTVQTYFLYFVYAYNSDANFYSFRSDLTVVSQYLINHCEQSTGPTRDSTFLVLDQFSIQTTDYLTSNRYGHFDDRCNVPYHQVDPEHAYMLPKLLPGQEVVFTQSSMFDTVKYKKYHPEAHLYLETRDKFGAAILAVYRAN